MVTVSKRRRIKADAATKRIRYPNEHAEKSLTAYKSTTERDRLYATKAQNPVAAGDYGSAVQRCPCPLIRGHFCNILSEESANMLCWCHLIEVCCPCELSQNRHIGAEGAIIPAVFLLQRSIPAPICRYLGYLEKSPVSGTMVASQNERILIWKCVGV